MNVTDLKTGPPGGWNIIHPDSAMPIGGITFFQLCQRVAQHEANNHYEYDEPVSERVQQWICEGLSDEDRRRHCSDQLPEPASVHWKRVVSFLTALAKWAVGGFEQVPQEEAERRAAICAKCPYNVGLSGCAPCRDVIGVLRAALLRASTSKDDELKACGICGCDNKTQVHFPLSTLRKGREMRYPDWCWKKS